LPKVRNVPPGSEWNRLMIGNLKNGIKIGFAGVISVGARHRAPTTSANVLELEGRIIAPPSGRLKRFVDDRKHGAKFNAVGLLGANVQ
jgi:hypothetical protein